MHLTWSTCKRSATFGPTQDVSIIRDLVRSFTGCSRLVRLTYVHSDLAGAESITYSYLRRKCNLVQALRFCTGHTAHSGSRGIALHNEELNDLYSLPNIVRVVKSRRMRWVGHVARMGEDRGVHRVLVGKPAGGRQHRGCIMSQAVKHSLVLLKMGKIISRNMLSWLELLISRYCCI